MMASANDASGKLHHFRSEQFVAVTVCFAGASIDWPGRLSARTQQIPVGCDIKSAAGIVPSDKLSLGITEFRSARADVGRIPDLIGPRVDASVGGGKFARRTVGGNLV